MSFSVPTMQGEFMSMCVSIWVLGGENQGCTLKVGQAKIGPKLFFEEQKRLYCFLTYTDLTLTHLDAFPFKHTAVAHCMEYVVSCTLYLHDRNQNS